MSSLRWAFCIHCKCTLTKTSKKVRQFLLFPLQIHMLYLCKYYSPFMMWTPVCRNFNKVKLQEVWTSLLPFLTCPPLSSLSLSVLWACFMLQVTAVSACPICTKTPISVTQLLLLRYFNFYPHFPPSPLSSVRQLSEQFKLCSALLDWFLQAGRNNAICIL